MAKSFFKVIFPDISAKRLKIPTSFTDYKNGELPRKVSLRDRFGNMWPIGVTKTGEDIYFEDGWERFTEENILEFGDFLIFDFDGNRIFDFKLLGINGCDKKGIGGLKLCVKEEEAEEMNIEHQKSVEPKGKNWASDSSSSSSSDDSDEEEGYEEEEEEEGNERAEKFNKKAPRLKGCKRADACKVSDRHDPFGTDIFRSGRATQPKNPYFVAKIRSNKTYQLYIPNYVARDYKLELPSSIIIRDSTGREFEAKLRSWKDGRISLFGGWRSLCKWNLVEKNNKCICEFVRGKHNKVLYLQVRFLHEIASSDADRR
ncbi:hypothetical protein HAX54_012867 [Datura stramonium]|uniref:TF-B3 domain-containing protein n=1 Tax=Datura stramonium TaxID=4076 RepID=A0ABS8RXQ9_DATST|nr:hypothetical protein [Datura stramonium]